MLGYYILAQASSSYVQQIKIIGYMVGLPNEHTLSRKNLGGVYWEILRLFCQLLCMLYI